VTPRPGGHGQEVSRAIPSALTSVVGAVGTGASVAKDDANGGAVGAINGCSEMEVGAVGQEISTSTIDGAENCLFASASGSSPNVAGYEAGFVTVQTSIDEFNLSHGAINLFGEAGGGRRIDSAGHSDDAW
jgi:hypothetical protein